jgi:ubiquinone/menaquinone biosynthesis C-methylase UbiE
MIEQLSLKNNGEKILEIGYGTGMAINLIVNSYVNVKITGIDFSKLMFKKAFRKNRKFINIGKVKLFYGDVLNFDFKDEYFDKIFAVNVIYFCKDLENFFSKLKKLLNPRGEILFYMVDKEHFSGSRITKTDIFQKYNIDYVLDELVRAGYKNVRYENSRPGDEKAYCVIGEK